MTRKSGFAVGRPVFRWSAIALLLLAGAGCATVKTADPRDPLEAFNRSMFSFNDELDKAIFKPAATIYRDATPQLVRQGVSNFLGNLEDVWSFVNSLLQGKPAAAAQSFMRFNVNTVFGVGGVFDIASDIRLERQREDFGQTLGVWGFPAGPYVVLPVFGPSVMRDLVAWPVDIKGDIVSRIADIPVRNTLKLLDQLDTRASFLSLGTALEEGALDRYSFTRDAFLQRRRNAVYDGNPPDEPVGDAAKAP